VVSDPEKRGGRAGKMLEKRSEKEEKGGLKMSSGSG